MDVLLQVAETASPGPEETGEEPEEDPFAEEDEDALLAEFEELEARGEISEAGRRQLAALRRNRKGRLMSELRATTLKQVSGTLSLAFFLLRASSICSEIKGFTQGSIAGF